MRSRQEVDVKQTESRQETNGQGTGGRQEVRKSITSRQEVDIDEKQMGNRWAGDRK